MTRIASGSPVFIGEPDGLLSSGADCNSILNLGDARRPPSRALGLLSLGPRPNGTLQSHFAAVRLDSDAVRVDLRTAAKGLLDLALDLGRSDAGFISIELVTPLIPFTRRAASSARVR